MGLTASGGKLVYKSGALGTGAACCCGTTPTVAGCCCDGDFSSHHVDDISTCEGLAFSDADAAEAPAEYTLDWCGISETFSPASLPVSYTGYIAADQAWCSVTSGSDTYTFTTTGEVYASFSANSASGCVKVWLADVQTQVQLKMYLNGVYVGTVNSLMAFSVQSCRCATDPSVTQDTGNSDNQCGGTTHVICGSFPTITATWAP